MDKEFENEMTRSHAVLVKGIMVAHYRIAEMIGAGGMGEVYLAEDTKLGRKVAIKFLPSHLVSDAGVKARFIREAQTLAKLNHPNIVSVHDVNDFNGRPYYVMELVEGDSLHNFAHERPLPFELIIEYAIQICQGLGEAHRAGIVHRDIKAANIIVDGKGRIRLLDFGLAAVAGDMGLTRTGSTLGTVSYMSPEQVSGREIDHRSDLFSLGIVLYELIAGRTPFKRESEGATLKAIIEDNAEPLSRYKSDVPEKLQEIVMKLLEKDKELRYQSAEGVIADLKRLVYDSSQANFTKIIPRKKKRSKLIFGVSAMAVVFIAVSLYFILGPTVDKPSADDSTPMIAVKPFENLGAPEDEYFADGITDEITSRLAGISGLGVISRTSAMVYKNSNKNLKQIGQELGVDYILEGTVRWSKFGDRPRVRITPQLVRVSDDRHIWAENYEREMLEVFAVQADIAAKIVDQLGVTLVQKDLDNLDERPTSNPEAYALYLKALSLLGRLSVNYSGNAPALKAAIDSSITLDPNFALAHALRSKVYSWTAFGAPGSEDAKIAKKAAERALELKPGLAQGHIALGIYYNLVETNYDNALSEFNKAETEISNDPDLLEAIALVQIRQGLFQESAQKLIKAAELDPLNPSRHRAVSLPLRFMRSFKESNNALDRAIALDPKSAEFWQDKIKVILSWQGDRRQLKKIADDAVEHCDSVEFLSGESYLMEQLPDIPWKRVMQQFRDRFRGWQPIDYYFRLAQLNYFLGDSVLTRAYNDSLRITIEQKLSNSPDDWESISSLGTAYSLLGNCDLAVKYGQLGMDSLSVDKCHW